ncbi:hypothetical protein [Microvirga splendida]|uniref:Uncharacterized protein n=1 Tax=Microvirga splendida TaxID=2795727 RepID=A0ABS0Y6E1_9HYPH|nr:hypothetical protein [Microvirga splendida]MBJ6127866.1 hypothetical protein [Microvirga splendida]
MATFFNEYFGVTADQVDDYGAFNISIINDLPLFIDPFLLFNSNKPEYNQLHSGILRYIIFLRDAVLDGRINDDLEKAWFYFPEVKQNWLGFSLQGNGGSGLGGRFAAALRANLQSLFANFGRETISRGSHIEKVCLVRDGVGRDNISDFTTNLVKDFLCSYTEAFTVEHIDPALRRKVWVNKARFNYETKVWERVQYDLPWLEDDFVLLTPKDILTRDQNWINRSDMIRDFEQIPVAIPDAELRGQVFNYFESVLAKPKNRLPSQRERAEAAVKTLISFPQLVDYYIKIKEDHGDEAKDISAEKVTETQLIFDTQLKHLQQNLATHTGFYTVTGDTYAETHQRLAYLKDVIENKGGHRIFYHDGVPIQRESDLQILCRLVWFGSPSDVGTEANDGRGPVDYKISRGALDKTLIEMKLAKNTGLERNLEKQLPIYQAASDAENGIKAIIYFTTAEQARVEGILARLGILGHKDVVLIDARNDNKPSGSKA